MPRYEMSFYDYWRIIRRRQWVIILSFIAVLGTTIAFTQMQIPTYRASTTIKIEERKSMAGLLVELLTWGPGDTMATSAEIIKSRPIMDEVAKRMGLVTEAAPKEEIDRMASSLQGAVSVKREGMTNILRIMASTDNPQKAIRLANTTAEAFIAYNFEERRKDARMVRKFIEEQLAGVEEKLRVAEEKLKAFREKGKGTGVTGALTARFIDLRFKLSSLLRRYTERHPEVIKIKEEMETLRKEMKLVPAEEIELTRIMREVSANESLYLMLQKKFKEAQIREAEKVGTVSVIDRAVGASLVSPNKKLNFGVGAVIGLMLGLLFAFVTESLDTSVGTIEEVEAYLKIPVLGVIPHIPEAREEVPFWRRHRVKAKEKGTRLREQLIVHWNPKSTVSEAYRSLQTNIDFTRMGKKGDTLLFVSAEPREGKTLTVCNCAVALAQMGKKVLLVESDLRRPVLHRIFGLKKEPGLTDILIKKLKAQEAIRTTTDIILGDLKMEEVLKTPGLDNLSLLTSGHLPPNPTELLGSPEMRELISEFKTKYDVILFDSSPILPVTDGTILGAQVDGVVMVYQVGRAARGALRRAKVQLDNAKAHILGIVLNDIRAAEMRLAPHYYYRYRYYGEEKERRGLFRRRKES
ncbi:Tyrosine-protein kinase wzc [subsurface metagenome]